MRMKFKAMAGIAALALVAAVPQAMAPAPVRAAANVALLPDVADLVDKLLPTVVEISVQSKNPNEAQAGQPDTNPFKDFFDEFLKRKQDQSQNDQSKPDTTKPNDDPSNKDQPKPQDNNLVSSMGSGFIIDPKGLIVTNNHVIADAVNIQVHLQDGTLMKAELVGHDPKTDIAVIRVKPDHDLPAASFGDSEKVRIGQWAGRS